MQALLTMAIIFGGIVLALAVIGSTILMGIKIIRGGLGRNESSRESEEARMIQEVYQGLSRLEERIESLETILLDRERKDQRG